ncbi:hypothetical protein SprV_0100329200 [Sparganum proliferum]
MIFAARQLQKCQKMRVHLETTFVDLRKALNTMNRKGLWEIMRKLGFPERFTQMVRQLHNGMVARATDNGGVSEAFAVTNGVKPSCVLAPTLQSHVLRHATTPTVTNALGSASRKGRQTPQSAYSLPVACTHELLFANDCPLNATTEGNMQRSMDPFAVACDSFGPTINTDKAVVMHQPSTNAEYVPQITVNGNRFQPVDNFTYLGGTLAQRKHRQRSGLPALQSLASLWPAASLRVESSRPST